jgi:hypothetical protein
MRQCRWRESSKITDKSGLVRIFDLGVLSTGARAGGEISLLSQILVLYSVITEHLAAAGSSEEAWSTRISGLADIL